jgi:hypothetical protein
MISPQIIVQPDFKVKLKENVWLKKEIEECNDKNVS